MNHFAYKNCRTACISECNVVTLSIWEFYQPFQQIITYEMQHCNDCSVDNDSMNKQITTFQNLEC